MLTPLIDIVKALVIVMAVVFALNAGLLSSSDSTHSAGEIHQAGGD